MGRAHALPSPSLEQLMGASEFQDRVQQYFLCGLPIRKLFGELQQGHKGQSPLRLSRLSFSREEMGEATIVEHRPEPVAQFQQQSSSEECQSAKRGRISWNQRR